MKVIRNSKNIWNHRKFGITLLFETWSHFFFSFTSNIRFMSFCMEFGKMTLLLILHLLYNLITSTFCNDRNMCSCALFVLAQCEAKIKARFFKLWHVSFTFIFTINMSSTSYCIKIPSHYCSNKIFEGLLQKINFHVKF